MYERKSRLSDWKRSRLIEHFVTGTTARVVAELVRVHRNTAASYYTRLRKVIAEEMERASPFAGKVELVESYFGGVRKGKRGRGAGGKVPVFGLLKRGGKVQRWKLSARSRPGNWIIGYKCFKKALRDNELY